MELTNNTVLITGGSSGIGLELALQLVRKDNKVIVCGRSADRLEKAKNLEPALNTFACDISTIEGRTPLVSWVKQNHSDCNVLVNNAAIVHNTRFYEDESMVEKAALEISTNLLAPISLSKMFLPIIEQHSGSTIINITTGLVFTPRVAYPIYNATKSGLHSFSQVLREQLKCNDIGVAEVMMTVVDTPWHNGNPPKIAISPTEAVTEMIKKLEKSQKEIKIGKVKLLYLLSRLAPTFAFRKINGLK